MCLGRSTNQQDFIKMENVREVGPFRRWFLASSRFPRKVFQYPLFVQNTKSIRFKPPTAALAMQPCKSRNSPPRFTVGFTFFMLSFDRLWIIIRPSELNSTRLAFTSLLVFGSCFRNVFIYEKNVFIVLYFFRDNVTLVENCFFFLFFLILANEGDTYF